MVCLLFLFAEFDDIARAQLSEEGEPRYILTFGLYHVVHIVFEQIEGLVSPALDLELRESHRDIFVPDIIGGYVGAHLLYIKNGPADAGTLLELLSLGDLLIEPADGIVGVRVIFHEGSVFYLLQADSPVMFGAHFTAGVAAGVYQQLALFLIGDLFEYIEFIVKVIIYHNYMIILFDLSIQRIGVGDALAGGACELIVRIVLSYVFFKQWRENDSLIQTVIRKLHDHIAEAVIQVLFLKHGISKSKPKRDTSLVKGAYDLLYKRGITVTAAHTASVPQRRREAAVNGSDLHALTKILGIAFEHFRKDKVESEMTCKVRQMESYSHNNYLTFHSFCGSTAYLIG